MTGHGLGDPRLAWVVLLDLALDPVPSADELAEGLGRLAGAAGWNAPDPEAVRSGTSEDLLPALATASSDALRLGRHEAGVILAGRHEVLDGLALLTASRRLLGIELRSSARGLPADAPAARGSALLRRLWEVALAPPARVASTRRGARAGDAFAACTVPGVHRTAELVHAGARAVSEWNAALGRHGRASRRTSVAVGASRIGGAADSLADDSAFLRLTRVETMSLEQVRDALAHAPAQPGGVPAGGKVLAAALRLAAPRLGSTLLVSHLGTLEADDRVRGASFYPVTGGGSGVSLGAATVRGATTITLRARAAQHDDDALQHLLERVVAQLR